MLSLFLTALFLLGVTSARNVPGPTDPDTYPGTSFQFEVSPGVIITEDLTAQPEDYTAVPKDVKLLYFNKDHPNEGKPVDITNPVASLKTTDFDKSRPTVFVIHGWKNNGESPICVLIRQALLQNKKLNIFVVDWSEVAMRNYVTARRAVSSIGGFVGDFINAIKVGNGLNLDMTRIVGHSLGAHVSGFAGAKTNAKVSQIIGLDPAFPLFYFSKPGERLSENDAQFVEVIHTNGYTLGFPYSIGHSDYYPNGGNSQAGCFLDITGSCAHARAYLYYEESIKTGNFASRLCGSYKKYKKGECNTHLKANMGQYDTDTSAKGDFYLDTNTASPFAKGG